MTDALQPLNVLKPGCVWFKCSFSSKQIPIALSPFAVFYPQARVMCLWIQQYPAQKKTCCFSVPECYALFKVYMNIKNILLHPTISLFPGSTAHISFKMVLQICIAAKLHISMITSKYGMLTVWPTHLYMKSDVLVWVLCHLPLLLLWQVIERNKIATSTFSITKPLQKKHKTNSTLWAIGSWWILMLARKV